MSLLPGPRLTGAARGSPQRNRHFISYALTAHRTDLKLTGWLGSHLAAVARQATPGASVSLAVACLSYELLEKRFLRLERLFAMAREPAPERPAAVVAGGP